MSVLDTFWRYGRPSDMERIKREKGNDTPGYIKSLEAEAENLTSRVYYLEAALESTTSLLDRCAKRLPDPAKLNLVLQLAVCEMANVTEYGALPERDDHLDAISHVRDLLKGVAV